MTAATEAKLTEMMNFAKDGSEIYPFMFQPLMGRSNSVSAAIRLGKKRGLIEESGKDGMGKPIYRLVVPAATHAAPATLS